MLGQLGEGAAQTFVQLTDLGASVGPRLTRSIAVSRTTRALFGRIGAKVSFTDHGIVYQFASDPEWGRTLIGRWNEWIHEFEEVAGTRLQQPFGIDISARRRLYAVDSRNRFIVRAEFSPTAQNLVNAGVWASPTFPRAVDVAWDGQSSPLTTDYLYVLDDSLHRVSYWFAGDSPTLLWTYGSRGASAGQFWAPAAVCVGKAPSTNGGTGFTSVFYIVDRGNKRLVQLQRTGAGATWVGATSIAGWDPTDCAVDHFGNVYIVESRRHRLQKFTANLYHLASCGTYGTGPFNYNTFANPIAVSVPCGLKTVNSVTVWYCEGRTITAELWSNTTGAVEHYLGIDASILAQPQANSGVLGGWFGYKITDHAYHTVEVLDWNGFVVAAIPPAGLAPSGTQYPYWDGTDAYGNPTLRDSRTSRWPTTSP
jgi:hypothetical protein